VSLLEKNDQLKSFSVASTNSGLECMLPQTRSARRHGVRKANSNNVNVFIKQKQNH